MDWNRQFDDLGDPPILMGPWDSVEGYYLLERLERDAGHLALEQHTELISIWYDALNLHSRAFASGFRYDCPEDMLRAMRLRSELLALGLISSKTTLDALIRANYSPAFAGARHMLESWCLSRYVELWPETANLFYTPAPGESHQGKVPPVKNMLTRLKQHTTDPRALGLLDQAQQSWKAMSKGAHPTGVGIVQTHGAAAGQGILGAHYHPSLWTDGIRHGLTSALLLVHETGRLQKQSREWEQQVIELGMRTVQLLNPKDFESLIASTRASSANPTELATGSSEDD